MHLNKTLHLRLPPLHGRRRTALRARVRFVMMIHRRGVRERIVRFPILAFVRGDFLHHFVDLFEREAFGFGDEDVGEEGAEGAGGSVVEKGEARVSLGKVSGGGGWGACLPPDEEDADAEVAFVFVDDEGCYDGDDAVPEPGECQMCFKG